MPLCPVCSAELKESKPANCWNCGADFSRPLSSKPLASTQESFRKFAAKGETQLETDAKPGRNWFLRGVLAVPVFLVGLLLFMYGGAGGLIAFGLGVSCFFLAILIWQSNSGIVLAIASALGVSVLVLMFVALQFIAAAASSR